MSNAETYIDAPVTRAEVEAGAWVRPEHAASALGVDERTIRRRVRSGAFVRTELGGRVYVRQAPPLPPTSDTARPAPEHEHELAQAFAVVERLALELGHARATVEQLERVRLSDAATVLDARRALEREQARANATEEQLAQARATAEHERQRTAAFVAQVEAERMAEQARAARLERLAQAPWYAVRERKRLRRELASA